MISLVNRYSSVYKYPFLHLINDKKQSWNKITKNETYKHITPL